MQICPLKGSWTVLIDIRITNNIMQYWPEVSTALQDRDDNHKTEESEPSARATATRLEHNVYHIIISSYHLARTITAHLVSPLSPPHRTCINRIYVLFLEVSTVFTRNIWRRPINTALQITLLYYSALLLNNTCFLVFWIHYSMGTVKTWINLCNTDWCFQDCTRD
jgi:hypothetical protein